MTRIFLSLAILSLLLMATALVMGLLMGDLYASPPAEKTLIWARVHRLTGVAAALSVVFVNSIVVTYFVGTSRWCKEVVETYRLDGDLARQSAILKRRTFPWAVVGMLTVVGVAALGAAADPATGRLDETGQLATAGWATIHLAGALAGLTIVAWVYFVCWNNVLANHQSIERILDQVRRIREEKGLDVEDEIQPASQEG